MEFSFKKLITALVRRGSPGDKLILNPKKDWKTIVIFFATINLLVIGLNLYFFQKIRTGEFFEVPIEKIQSTEFINKKMLLEIVSRYEIRRASLEELRRSSVFYQDPSL